MTVQPKSLLDFQVYLEENPGLPDQLSGFAFAVHRDSSTLTSAADLKGREATSASAFSDIITTMYSLVSTRWSITSLVGPLLPAGFLVPVRGKLATDPIHLRYIVAETFVGTKKDHYPANPSHLVGFSGQEVFSHGDDLDGTSLSDGSLSVYSISYDDSMTAHSPTHFRSIPSSKRASRTKSLRSMYPGSVAAITSSISTLLHISTAEDSHNGFWVSGEEAAQRISVPAIFPVPFNTDFTICHDVPVVSSLVNKDERTAMIKLFTEAGARGSSFLVNDPVFNLFVEAVSTFPDSFVPVKTRTNEFSSLPFVEFQDAARASTHFIIADNLDFIQQGNDVPLNAYKQSRSSLFQPPNWDTAVQPRFLSCPPLMPGLKSIFAVTDMSKSVPCGQAHHAATPQAFSQSFGNQQGHSNAHRSLFSSVVHGQSPAPHGTSHHQLGIHKLSSSQETRRTMGLIDFHSRKGAFPFTPTTQDFDFAMVDTTAPLSLKPVTDSANFILADLNPYSEIQDNPNRINSVRDNFSQCQGELGLVSTHCQHACSDISRFFCDKIFGKIFVGPLCQAALDSHPFDGFSPIHYLLLFDDVSQVSGLPLLPYNGFPSYQLVEDFIGSILVLLTYLWSYDHCKFTLLYQGYSHLLDCLCTSNLHVNWNNRNFPRAEYSLTILELAHNLFAAVAKHACCMPVQYRSNILLKSSNGVHTEVMTVPTTVKSLQSSMTFSDIIMAWYAKSTSAFSLIRHSNNGILSPTFTKTS